MVRVTSRGWGNSLVRFLARKTLMAQLARALHANYRVLGSSLIRALSFFIILIIITAITVFEVDYRCVCGYSMDFYRFY